MKRLTIFLGLVLLLGCDDTTAPQLPPLTLQIIAPAPGSHLREGETVLLVGEVTADDIGLLPEDSVWWSAGGTELARGRVIEHRAQVGTDVYRFHARYRRREDSVAVSVQIQPSVGLVRFTVPLAWYGGAGLAMGPDGTLYTRDGLYGIVAVAPTGEVRWRVTLPAFMYNGLPATAPDGTSFWSVGPGNVEELGGVIAITAAGSLDWFFDTGEQGLPGSRYYHVHGGVAVDDAGTIYFGTDEYYGPIYAVNRDGMLRWRVYTASRNLNYILSSVVLVDDSLAVAVQRSDSVVALSTETGGVRWKAELTGGGSRDLAPAVGDGGTLYLARGTTLLALKADGREIWRTMLDKGIGSGGPVLRGDQLYLANAAGGVTVFDAASGNLLERFGPTDAVYFSSATVGANGVVYAASKDTLFSYDALSVRRYAVPLPIGSAFGGPLVDPWGTVYIRSEDGLVAVGDTIGPATDAVWPVFRGNSSRTGRPSS